ncbi:nucleoid-associated protein [Cellvibrio sp. QJXJ]|uniref:nucleoid-associated protein n=1 Tax=Cellvibrio sp. QJXJ TaxID=2964606 RepID=UPI0021C42435|nr:nucleoid-associated protein [Cellvibrio sp. QJXJ]UUA73117.1 nucleoid-associated protein [Cellvibrio sp. QJXJ]
MTIHHVVAHELIKDIDNQEAAKELNEKGAFDKSLPILQRFIDTTDKAFNKKPKALGKFDPDEVNYPFQKTLVDYLTLSNHSEDEFLDMTSSAMDTLAAAATGVTKASGGIVIFMHYDDSFMVLLLSRKVVFNIKDFELENLEAMDIDSMRYAAKISVSGLLATDNNEEKDPYIGFMRGTATTVSSYFLEFIGCKDYQSPKASTDGMIEAVREYMTSLGYSTDKRRDIEQQILSYCAGQRKAGNHVYLSAIAPLIDPENENGLIEYISEKNFKCPDVFEADPSALRKLKRYDYKSKKWSLSFDHDLYGGTITFNKDDNTITITDIPDDFESSLDLVDDEDE